MVLVCCVVSVSRLFAGLEMLLSNSSEIDSLLDILANVSSLRSVFDNVRAVSNSCKYCLCCHGFEMNT